MEWIFALVTASAVGWLLGAERRGARLRFVAKPLASSGFIGLAVSAGVLDSGFGIWVLAALVLSAVGDVALLGSSEGAFLSGLGAFLAAHIAYAVAFLRPGLHTGRLVAAIPLAVFAAVVWRWLRPHLPRRMRVPVVVYVLAISLMGLLAFATRAGDLRIPAGASLFIASDIAVARNTFVAPGYANKLWGLPLYYGGQLLL
ncbi:MAG: lysoplasmalogenase, partial [Acidimicrobiia bacterium]|nr:lysoplasmalogenase [Acidimicrobiia bacterium]